MSHDKRRDKLQINYGLWTWRYSKPRPPACKTGALPTELQALPPHRPFPPGAEVFQVGFIFISLTLETDVPVSVAPAEQPDQPFKKVQQIERQIPQLPHLGCVNFFVVQHFRSHISPCASHKQNAKEVDGKKSFERDEPIIYDFHISKNYNGGWRWIRTTEAVSRTHFASAQGPIGHFGYPAISPSIARHLSIWNFKEPTEFPLPAMIRQMTASVTTPQL